MVKCAQETNITNKAWLVHHSCEKIEIERGLRHFLFEKVEVLGLHRSDDWLGKGLRILCSDRVPHDV